MTHRYHAPLALLPDGWARDVSIVVDEHGIVASVTPGVGANGDEPFGGPVVPSMPNLHSHAFQRAVAGRTGHAGASGEDSFWTWRESMYRFLERLDPDAFEAIAAQVYVEMAKAGYGCVAEFHYVHRDASGAAYANPAEMGLRALSAARRAGIAITLLPVHYAHGGFGSAPASRDQRRFCNSTDDYAAILAALARPVRDAGAVLGVAPHSLRATTPDEIDRVLALVPGDAPVHIHVAEQTREVDDCLAWSGRRPVAWLLERHGVGPRWCLVHATHLSDDETRDLAASGAVAGLAPTTEADLGDGTFNGVGYTRARGRWGVGSDSNTIVDPFAELRQFEYSQRLAHRRRNLLHLGSDDGIGRAMWQEAAAGGAQACGRRSGVIAVGAHADLLVLDADEPALVGHDASTLMDAAIFGPARRPVRHAMVGGRWCVRDGRHPEEEAILAGYRRALDAVLGSRS